ncbi:metallophosphoesterase family protein [Lysinibacillus sp. BW-2-10]|uniref:metallophosphoesterase family protein n=1 Tax=Lysinibacillus sp. BW-2-10 TaxID=2590030 RepID=UPI001180E78A|nr:metallophosphoesterase family protein [Lysinibacillus sp. BW-2-10]TSI05279.1 serine/threonine protein phosphatase [Lysinibacillus sp. BW-2-10]
MHFFVVSDIHGMYKQFEEILSYWDKKSILVILGDLIDRGKQSYEVVRKVMDLQKQYGDQVINLKGNHEDLFLKFIENPALEYGIYFRNGGLATLKSFINDFDVKVLSKHMDTLKMQYSQEIEFIKSGLSYYQIGQLLFTHAGFESNLDNWQDTSPSEYIWIRDHYQYPNKTNFINVFGHTPTYHIHGVDDIWESPCHTYIGIDGACAYGGQLNALLISVEGEILQQFVVDNGGTERKEKLKLLLELNPKPTFESVLQNIQQKINGTDQEMGKYFGFHERQWRYLLEGKIVPRKEFYSIVYNTFSETLTEEEKSLLIHELNDSGKVWSVEDIEKLLFGDEK